MADKYVDFGATYNGDGTAPTAAASAGAEGAYNTVVGVTLTTGDKLWIRRSATSVTLAANLAPAIGGCFWIGWPKSGDSYYSTRPAAGTSAGWDSDSSDYAVIQTANATYRFTPTGNNAFVSRIHFSSTLTTWNTVNPLVSFGAATGCSFEDGKVSFSATTSSSYDRMPLYCTGANFTVKRAILGGTFVSGDSTSSMVTASGDSAVLQGVTVSCDYAYTGLSLSIPVIKLGTNANVSGLSITLKNAQSYHLSGASMGSLLTWGDYSQINDVTISSAQTTYQGPQIIVSATNSQITNMQCTEGGGRIVVSGGYNNIQIPKWAMSADITTASIGALHITGVGNTIQLGNSVLKASGSGASVYMSSGANATKFQFNHVSIPGSITWDSSYRNNEIWSINHNQIAGQFHYENRDMSLDSSNTYRTGGASYSIKGLTPRVGSRPRNGAVSAPTREGIYIPLASGNNTITLYGAYKNYSTAPSKNDIGFGFWYTDNTGTRQYASSTSTPWTALDSDSSTWNNDTGLTAFKCAIAVNTNGSQVVPVNIICGTAYDASGYFYVDPQPVVS